MKILHDNKLVHGSLDPNFLLPVENRNEMVILDAFKSTKIDEKSIGRIIFQNKYSSPEVIQKSRSINIEDDNWSIGMILLEMCFGSIPFSIKEYNKLTKESIKYLFNNKLYSNELVEIIINLLINRDETYQRDFKYRCNYIKNRKLEELYRKYSVNLKRIWNKLWVNKFIFK